MYPWAVFLLLRSSQSLIYLQPQLLQIPLILLLVFFFHPLMLLIPNDLCQSLFGCLYHLFSLLVLWEHASPWQCVNNHVALYWLTVLKKIFCVQCLNTAKPFYLNTNQAFCWHLSSVRFILERKTSPCKNFRDSV